MRPLGGLLRNSAKKCFVSSSFATGSAFNPRGSPPHIIIYGSL